MLLELTKSLPSLIGKLRTLGHRFCVSPTRYCVYSKRVPSSSTFALPSHSTSAWMKRSDEWCVRNVTVSHTTLMKAESRWRVTAKRARSSFVADVCRGTLYIRSVFRRVFKEEVVIGEDVHRTIRTNANSPERNVICTVGLVKNGRVAGDGWNDVQNARLVFTIIWNFLRFTCLFKIVSIYFSTINCLLCILSIFLCNASTVQQCTVDGLLPNPTQSNSTQPNPIQPCIYCATSTVQSWVGLSWIGLGWVITPNVPSIISNFFNECEYETVWEIFAICLFQTWIVLLTTPTIVTQKRTGQHNRTLTYSYQTYIAVFWSIAA